MTPSELLDDHARRPRNVGKLLNASAVGDVGSIVVGDALRFYIGLDAAGARIAQAKFQVFNCADQVAASSALTELAAGRSLDEAKALGPAELCAHLGGLDHALLPPRLWAAEGLRAAIAAYQGEELEHDQELDPLLCRCFGVSEETVRQAIAVHGCASVDEVVSATGAGSGCGSCRIDIPRLLEEAKAPAAEPAAKPERSLPGGRIQTLMRIQRTVESRLLPELRAAGGDLELWDFDGRVVKVRAGGALVGDDAARRAALAALEQLLKQEIDPGLGVEAAP
jgi:NifU-like protein